MSDQFGEPRLFKEQTVSCISCGRSNVTVQKCRTCDDYVCQDCLDTHLCEPLDYGDLGDLPEEGYVEKTDEQREKEALEWEKFHGRFDVYNLD